MNVPDFSALILAGRRGPQDALAVSRGATHRALLPVAGVPMLVRVVRALRAAGLTRLHVSIDAPELLDAVPELAELRRAGALRVLASENSPSRSVAAALAPDDMLPCLVTTADHALLTPAMIQHFLRAACDADADLLIAMVAATVVQAAYPETKRTYLRLRGESWSGANLFAFRTLRARKVADFYVRAERFRKQPWRLVAAIGPSLLLQYALRRLDLDTALAAGSPRLGARVAAVHMPQPEAAIDVDKEADLVLAEQILRKRGDAAR
ncbi:MAG TPA: nucleotidyltransferase family protein [Myxococcota bacterium]|nr:nucleotidyltransferase family protein [Myxococcota bacterium]